MKLSMFTEDEAYAHLEKAHNPPITGANFSEQDFAEEWHSVRDGLDRILQRFGENDAYGTKDYNLGDTVSLSRGVGLEVTSEKMLSMKLVPEVQNYLALLPHDYEIDLAIMTEDGVFHVFLGRNEIKAWCPKPILDRLGL